MRGSTPLRGVGSVHGRGTPATPHTGSIGTPSSNQTSSTTTTTAAATTTAATAGSISSVRGSVGATERENEKENKGFDKESVDSEFLSSTAHLSTSELRNRCVHLWTCSNLSYLFFPFYFI